MQRDVSRYLKRIAGCLNQGEQDALSAFPLPVLVAATSGEVIWYNDLFRNQVLDGNEMFGESVGVITDGASLKDLQKKKFIDVTYAGRRYTVHISPVRVREATLYVLYYVDDTQLKEIAEEYALSRPAVMMVYIDNIEEMMQNIRDSERAQLSGPGGNHAGGLDLRHHRRAAEVRHRSFHGGGGAAASAEDHRQPVRYPGPGADHPDRRSYERHPVHRGGAGGYPAGFGKHGEAGH